MKTLLALYACAATGSCYAAAGPQDGTRDVGALDHGADALGVVSHQDGTGDTEPTTETAETTVEPPKDNIFVQMIPGRYVDHEQNADYFYMVTVKPLQTIPYPGACPKEAIGRLEMVYEGDGEENYPSCLESNGSLSLCKNDATLCEGVKYKGKVYLGTCAFPGGDTSLVRCSTSQECTDGGYCDVGSEIVIELELTQCFPSGCQKYADLILYKL